MSTSAKILKAANRTSSGTFISRILGMMRDVAMAAAFGSYPAVAAFYIAFRFANVSRRVLGEGAVHAAFIPQFEAARARDKAEAAVLYRDLAVTMAVGVIFLIIGIETWLVAWLTFGHPDPGVAQTIFLTVITLPAILPIVIYALNSALLNCEGSFFIPSIAPAVVNTIWLIGIGICFRLPVDSAMGWLTGIVLFAQSLSCVVTIYPAWRYLKGALGDRVWTGTRILSRSVRKIGRPLGLAVLGVGTEQINSALDPLFARAADPSGPAILFYAFRIQQLPLAILGIALFSAIFPLLSKAHEEGNELKFRKYLSFGVQRGLQWMVACVAAILVLGLPAVNLIYGHGAFTKAATIQTTYCLWAYSFVLISRTLVLILGAAMYTKGHYKFPALCGAVGLIVNCGLNSLFVFYYDWGAVGVAIATAIASWSRCAMLVFAMRKEGIRWIEKGMGSVLLATLVAFAFTYWMFPVCPLSRSLAKQLLEFALPAACFAATFGLVYAGSSWIVGALRRSTPAG